MLNIKIVDMQNDINTVRVNADHKRERDFNHLANHIIKLRNFTKGEISPKEIFSPFRFSLHLMLELCNLIVCLMISQKLHADVAQTSEHVAVDTR